MGKTTKTRLSDTGGEGRRAFLMGLGNPGKEYEDTYHNVGKLALAALLAKKLGASPRLGSPRRKKFAHATYLTDGKLIWIEPSTFMNESGTAAREALAFFKGAPAELVVLHDDADLPVGSYKVTIGQRDAGHKGVQSVIEALGTNEFTRVRIGIGREPRARAESYVLSRITKAEMKKFGEVFDEIAEELFIFSARTPRPEGRG